MGNVSLILSGGNQWINRAQCAGFCNQPGLDHWALTGDRWSFEIRSLGWKWDLKVSAEFFPPTSNTYSIDHVLDLSDSWFYVGGTPSPSSIAFGIMYVLGEGILRLGTIPFGTGEAASRVDLPPLPGYWLPL